MNKEFEELIKEIANSTYPKNKIDFLYRNPGEHGIKQILNAFKTNTSIFSLSLADQNIIDEIAEEIADVLKKNKTLTKVHFAMNLITAKGAEYIAGALKKNDTITSISLSRNKIGDNGAKHIAEALEQNSTIMSIDLKANKITDQGVKYIADALEQNNTLLSMNLAENDITNEGVSYLEEAIKKNRSLIEVIGVDLTQKTKDILEFNKIKQNRKSSQYILDILDTEFDKLDTAQKTFIINIIADTDQFNKHINFLTLDAATLPDPQGLIKNNDKIYNSEEVAEIKETFKRLALEIKKDNEFMSGYFVTKFEQSKDAQGLVYVNNENLGAFAAIKAKDTLFELSKKTATKVTEGEMAGNVQKPAQLQHKISKEQRAYTKDLSNYNQLVRDMKMLDIITEKPGNNNNAKPEFIIDIDEKKVQTLKNPNLELLVKALEYHNATKEQISDFISKLPGTQIEKMEVADKEIANLVS